MSGLDIIKALAPVDEAGALRPGWQMTRELPAQYPCYVWQHEYGVRVLSAVEVVEDSTRPGRTAPHYHVSMTRWRTTAGGLEGPLRIDSVDAAYVLRTFFGGLEGWEEDNHVPNGKVRNFWRPVAEPAIGSECFCKRYEPRIIEDGGDFVWRPL